MLYFVYRKLSSGRFILIASTVYLPDAMRVYKNWHSVEIRDKNQNVIESKG